MEEQTRKLYRDPTTARGAALQHQLRLNPLDFQVWLADTAASIASQKADSTIGYYHPTREQWLYVKVETSEQSPEDQTRWGNVWDSIFFSDTSPRVGAEWHWCGNRCGGYQAFLRWALAGTEACEPYEVRS